MNRKSTTTHLDAATRWPAPVVYLLIMAFSLCGLSQAQAQAPDLTNGGLRTDELTWNLGPTGMSGWFYRENFSAKYAGWDTDPARQIEVTQVDAGSPADGVLLVGDVILGADGAGAQPFGFTSDARKSFAYAIADAEASNPATLKLLVWRAGNISTLSITLETMGAYSATAPYNCPKSAAVLEKGLAAIMAGGGTDAWRFSLVTLLAGNDPSNPDNAARMARAQQEAHDLILTQEQLDLYTSDVSLTASKIAWEIGFKLVAIAEYYLMTADPAVYDSMHAYATAYVNGQSMFGTSGHQFALQGKDGSLNGPYGVGYGVVNSANMQCFYGLLLAREAGLTDQKFQDAIDRASRFYGVYVDRGTIPYGEHAPTATGLGENGKHGIAALCYKLEGARNYDANYYSKLAGSSAYNLDAGHQGPWMNYLWSPLGANAGGEESMAAFFAETSWYFDLARNWDGSFTYNSYQNGGQYGYGGSTWSAKSFQMSTACLLPYAAPLRQTYITGKGNLDQGKWLTSAEVAAVELSSGYDATNRSTTELLADVASWSPVTRLAATKEIGLRSSEHATLIPIFHSRATDTNGSLSSRMGACLALGEISGDSSFSLLMSLLSDSEGDVRWAAASAIPHFSGTLKLAAVDAIMEACIAEAKPLLPLDEADPIHTTHAAIAGILFDPYSSGILRNHDLVGIDRDLFYPTVRSVLNNPRGEIRKWIVDIYGDLSREDIEALADAIVPAAYAESPADRMNADAIRTTGIDLLQEQGFAEGIPVSKKVFNDIIPWKANHTSSLTTLENYAGSATLMEPDPKIEEFCELLIASGIQSVEAQAVIDAIAADVAPVEPTPLKRINYIHLDDSSLTLPADRTVLRAETHNYVQEDSVYTWRKVHGAGDVSFFPNGTASANTTNVIFDGTPGEYLLELRMSDSLGLTEVAKTITYTLYDTGGSLPSNTAPTADAQPVIAEQGTPIPIILTGTDPEGYELSYTVTSGPSYGTITGTAPNLLYTPFADHSGLDSITFEVMDSEGQISSSTISITVNTLASPIGLAIYEPFDYPAGELDGVSGASEIGLEGSWTSGAQIYTEESTLTYDTVPSSGLRLWSQSVNAPGASRPIKTTALAGRGLLDDGSTLWFSVMVGYEGSSFLKNFQMALANSSMPLRSYIANDGAELGTGLGVFMYEQEVYAAQYFDSSQGTSDAAPLRGDWDELAAGTMKGTGRLIVGKITWGASSDTVEIYLLSDGVNLPEKASSTLIANVDQSKFDVLTFGRAGSLTFDEVRFGATHQSVVQGTVEMSPDVTAPTPDPMAFVLSPTAANSTSITMAAAQAYDAMGVECYFTCTAGGGNDSGWQASNVYTDTGLTPGVQYSYTVKTRDLSPALNETAASTVQSATIPSSGVVPNVLDISQATAELLILDADFSVGVVTPSSNYSMTVPAGIVISQTPTGAAVAAYGTAVDLVVSVGQDPALPVLLTANIEDDARLLPVYNGETVTYTLTFCEAMDLSTIQASDFVNLGRSPITIGTITQISPDVVTVEVTPSGGVSAGTIRFAVAQGADIRNAAGDALNTTSAIVDDLTISVIAGTKPNSAPLFPLDPVPGADANEDVAYTGSIAGDAYDDDGDVLSFTKAGGPSWLSVATDGTLSGTPSNGNLGLNTFSLSVSDGNGASDTANLSITVIPVPDVTIPNPDPMTWLITPAPANASVLSSMTVSTVAPVNDGMDLSSDGTVTGGRSLFSDQPATGQTFTTGANGGTLRSLTGLMSNGVAYKTYVIRVGTISGTSFSEVHSETFSQFFDLGTDEYVTWDFSIPVTLAANTKYGIDVSLISSQESWSLGIPKLRNTADIYPGESSYQSGSGGRGSDSVTYRADEDLVFHLDISTEVSVVDNALIMTAASASDGSGVEYYFSEISGNLGGSDSGWQDSPAYTDTGLQTGLEYSYTVVARDKSANQNTTAPSTAAAATLGANNLPVWSIDPLSEIDATENGSYSSSLADDASDADAADILSFAKLNGPFWLIVGSDGSLTGTPTIVDIGVNSFTVSVTDGKSTPVVATLNITVNDDGINSAPVWTNDPIDGSDAREALAYSNTLAGSATDTDAGDTLIYDKVSGPDWLSVAPDGALSGTPVNADVGANSFTVSVTDGTIATPIEATLNITVDESGASWFATYISPGTYTSYDADSPFASTFGALTQQDPNNVTEVTSVYDFRGLTASVAADSSYFFLEDFSDGQFDVIGATSSTIDFIRTYDGINSSNNGGSNTDNIVEDTTRKAGIRDTNGFRIDFTAALLGGNLPTYVGIAFTELTNGATRQIRAYDSGDNLLETVTQTTGSQVADQFLGLSTVTGISYVLIEGDNEYDHFQYGTVAAPGGGDTTPPTLASSNIVDDQAGANVTENDLVTYTVSFSEDMDDTTVDAADFSNAGTASVTIGTVTETSPGVFTVEVTPTTAGSLQLQVNAAAVLTDVAGNALGTTAAIADDTTITVDEANAAPTWTTNPVNELSATEDAGYASTLADDASDADAGDTLSYTLVSAQSWLYVAANGDLSGTPTNADVGANSFTVSVTDGVIATPVEATLSITVNTPYGTWAGGAFTNPFTDTGLASNPDGDRLDNQQEYAFGLDPTVSDALPLTYVSGGAITRNGLPILQNFAAQGEIPQYRAVFIRRKDYATAGVVYSVEFSAELGQWTTSADMPTRVSGADLPSGYDAVSVPFPLTVPANGGTENLPPRFLRVAVQAN